MDETDFRPSCPWRGGGCRRGVHLRRGLEPQSTQCVGCARSSPSGSRTLTVTRARAAVAPGAQGGRLDTKCQTWGSHRAFDLGEPRGSLEEVGMAGGKEAPANKREGTKAAACPCLQGSAVSCCPFQTLPGQVDCLGSRREQHPFCEGVFRRDTYPGPLSPREGGSAANEAFPVVVGERGGLTQVRRCGRCLTPAQPATERL